MRLYGVILLLAIFGGLKGQDALFNHFSTENGLPTDNIYASVQGANGIIWFAGDGSAIALQGFDFNAYSLPPGNESNAAIGFELAQLERRRFVAQLVAQDAQRAEGA